MKSQLLIAAFEQQQHQNTLISKADKGKLECCTLTGSTSKQCTNLEKRSENHNSRVEYGKDDNRMCCCCCHSLETVCLPLSPTIEHTHTHTRTASKVIIHLPNMQNLYTQTIFFCKDDNLWILFLLFYSKLPSKWSNSCTKQCHIPLNFEGWPHLMVQQHLAAAR